jgi:hypothetical protein
VPGTYLKVGKIAATTVGLLERELVVARTVWTDAINPGEFTGALNDTVTMRVPARRVARKRTLRAGTAIVNDTSVEFGVPVKLDTDVYNGAPITDEELTLDIVDFGAQILNPQVRAVAEGVEQEIVDEIEDATYAPGMTINSDLAEFEDTGVTDWYRVANRARRLLSDKQVPQSGRTLLVGTEVEEAILNSERFLRADSIGAEGANSALRESTIGRIAGFNVVTSSFIDPEAAYAYHRTAFVLATRAPLVPRGVPFGTNRDAGAVGFSGGLSVRWLMDYDYTNTTDRSLVNTWVGTATVKDADNPQSAGSTTSLMRAVKITPGS